MGFFKLAGMTFGNIFTKKETLRYPAQSKQPYEGQKGTIAHIDKEKCNLCMVCQKKCPVGAIVVDKPGKTWSINHYQCVQCGYCVDSCPKSCLAMKGEKPSITLQIEMETFEIPLPDKKPAAAKSDIDNKPAAKTDAEAKAAGAKSDDDKKKVVEKAD